ncbi:MAG: hypothetical protein ACREJM_16495 [Candidatus Saccharimonadales bacterium]
MEVYLAILEQPNWCLSIAGVKSFKLLCRSGVAETHYGSLIFCLWRVAAEAPAESIHEHFLNPNRAETLKDLWLLARQTHLKTLIINSQASEVVNWFEFENNFGFDKVHESSMRINDTDFTDFDAAMEEFKQLYTIEKLLDA